MALVALSVVLVSTAQLSMKWGMSLLPVEGLDPDVIGIALSGGAWPPLLAVGAGLGCYALSMLCWVLALRAVPLGVAYPFLSLSYVLVYVGSLCLPGLADTFSWLKLAGIALIMTGVAITFYGGSKTVHRTSGT
ncbi:putative 4-amino-4-deoxy-L-arabinose-phosphoundecaprenol flippase subunit ArnF [Kushneria pakistanensis]|uniref:4-amino-4-deoxy-L-arabinose-phosphoundecaprenol flippase subunit ArnF n=2 Tax=Kushneria pakistanensis TaxID=1508770 RepID=A0ABQ3FPP8_9GAMM|nr:putative 4-amino-4-deoxy-L-arabinose-phosphoundecaprenol flippase subunit ArnF [Kushneria pakistanensis]